MLRKHTYYTIVLLASLLASGFPSQATFRNVADSLNREARRQFNADFGKALHLASEAKHLASTMGDTRELVAAACTIARVWANTNKCGQAIALLNGLRPAAVASKDASVRAMLYAATGECWSYYGKYDSACMYHELALSTAVKHGLSAEIAQAYLSLGKLFINKGIPQKASQYYDKALPILTRNGDKEKLSWAKHLLGEIFYAQRLYDKALTYLSKSYNDFRQQGNTWGEASALLHEGNVYYMQAKDDSASACYYAALRAYIQVGDSSGIAICYSNLSRVALEKGNTQQAIVTAQKALSSIRPGNYIVVEAGTYQQLGDIYGEQAEYKKAVAYIKKALKVARQADHKVIIKDCYKSLSELYQAMKQPELAMNNLLAAYRLKDSIQPVAFTRQLAEMEARYEAEKKTAEITLLKQQEQIQALRLQRQAVSIEKQHYLSGILFLAVIVTIGAAYVYTTRRRMLEQMRRQHVIRESQEKERQRIAKDVHDELGSGLSKIRFLAELANAQAVGTQQQLSGSLHSISDTSKGLVENMRDLIWAMNPENATLDNLMARIREYSHDYLEEFPIEVTFNFPEDFPDKKISKQANRNVFMIVKEVLQNIVKHASATSIRIALSITSELRLEIEDNGRGYDVTLATEGNGLKNIESRSRELGAKLQMISHPGKGTRIVFETNIENLA